MKPNKKRSFKDLAVLIPEEQREHFFETVSKFEVVPDDDEYLLLLEALGFLTVVFDKVPQRITEALDRAESGLSEDQAAALQRRFETILKDSVDTPSYKDLREMVREIKEERQKFKMTTDALSTDISSIPRVPRKGTFDAKALVLGCVLSLFCGGLLVGAALLTKLPGDRLNFTFRPKKDHDDHVDYFEDYVPEFGGSVGVFVVKGKVVNMVEHPDRGLVVVELPSQRLP